jgi:hypothetical protein
MVKIKTGFLLGVAACLLISAAYALAQAGGGNAPAATAQGHVRWKRGTYQGLTPGQSSRQDVEKVFGEPSWRGEPEAEPGERPTHDVMYEYTNVGGMKGRTSVIFDARSGVVKVIYLYPQGLTMEQAVAQYGSDYVRRGSGLGPCPTADDVRESRRQRSPDEYPIFLVYPQSGLYVTVQSDKTVLEVGYLADCSSAIP